MLQGVCAGVITIHTMIEDEAILDQFSSDYLIERDAADHLEWIYEIDAATKELFGYVGFIAMTDGSKQKVVEQERVLNPETYVVDEQLNERIFGEDQRTMTVIAYPGSDQETVYTQTVSKGSGFFCVPAEGGAFYMDAECTIPNEGIADKTIDVTLYYR